MKAVYADITALLNTRVVCRKHSGEIVFPLQAVKVEFLLEASKAAIGGHKFRLKAVMVI